jgi:drug/metabolite transporter (DMT)-like permease
MLYKQNMLLGALFIVLSEFFFASMGATVKAIGADLPSEMAVFLRNVFGMVLLLPLVWRYGFGRLATTVAHLHLLRGLAGVGAMYCLFYALVHLPLANGLLLKMTAPLFMPLIAWAWLSEELRRLTLLAIAIGFVGVVLVLNPQGEFNQVALVGLLGGVFASLAKVTVRRLGRTEPAVRVVFYFTLISTLVSSVPMLWAWQTPTATQWGLLLLVGALGTLGQLLLTRGYGVAAAASISPFTYFSVIFGALYGYFFWDEGLSMQFVAGALLIALAGITTLQSRRVRETPLVNEPAVVRVQAGD